MQVRLKQKMFGVAAAFVLGFTTIGATTLPASARGGGSRLSIWATSSTPRMFFCEAYPLSSFLRSASSSLLR